MWTFHYQAFEIEIKWWWFLSHEQIFKTVLYNVNIIILKDWWKKLSPKYDRITCNPNPVVQKSNEEIEKVFYKFVSKDFELTDINSNQESLFIVLH